MIRNWMRIVNVRIIGIDAIQWKVLRQKLHYHILQLSTNKQKAMGAHNVNELYPGHKPNHLKLRHISLDVLNLGLALRFRFKLSGLEHVR